MSRIMEEIYKKGYEEGYEEGYRLGITDYVVKLHSAGVDVALISYAVNRPVDVVNEIIQNNTTCNN